MNDTKMKKRKKRIEGKMVSLKGLRGIDKNSHMHSTMRRRYGLINKARYLDVRTYRNAGTLNK